MNIAKHLCEKYNGKIVKQTKLETIIYIDDIKILDELFNRQEKEHHEYNKKRLEYRLNDLDYAENTLIGKLIIIRIRNSFNTSKHSFSISPPCLKLINILKGF